MPLWEKFLVLQPVILTFGQTVRRFPNRIITIEAFWQCSPDGDHCRHRANSQGLGDFVNRGHLYLGPPEGKIKSGGSGNMTLKGPLTSFHEFWHQRVLFRNKSSDDIYKFPGGWASLRMGSSKFWELKTPFLSRWSGRQNRLILSSEARRKSSSFLLSSYREKGSNGLFMGSSLVCSWTDSDLRNIDHWFKKLGTHSDHSRTSPVI